MEVISQKKHGTAHRFNSFHNKWSQNLQTFGEEFSMDFYYGGCLCTLPINIKMTIIG